MIDPDDVIPSHLRIVEKPRANDAFNNNLLRMGEVIDLIQPDDKRSLSKKVIEYTVLTQHRANSTAVTKAYHHCFLLNSLASAADECTFTLRVDPNRKQGKVGLGSKVLILCVNGETNNAVIIGGIRDQASKYDQNNKDKKHHFHWVFNGISLDINDDGEVTLSYNGKTKVDGTVDDSVSSDNAGGTFSMTKDGQFNAKPKQGLKIGQANEHMVLGDSYRKAEKQAHTTLQTQFNQLQTALKAAAIALNTAGGAVAGPFMAAACGPALITASTQLQLAATAASQLSQALSDFEQSAGQKNSFLSQKHALD